MEYVAQTDMRIDALVADIAGLTPDDIFADPGEESGELAAMRRELDYLERKRRLLLGGARVADAYLMDMIPGDRPGEWKVPAPAMEELQALAEKDCDIPELRYISRMLPVLMSYFRRSLFVSAAVLETRLTEDYRKICADYIRSGEYSSRKWQDTEAVARKVEEAESREELKKLARKYGFSNFYREADENYEEFITYFYSIYFRPFS